MSSSLPVCSAQTNEAYVAFQFVLNVLQHPEFMAQQAKTDFIDKHPELFDFPASQDRGNKTLNYLAEVSELGRPRLSFNVIIALTLA